MLASGPIITKSELPTNMLAALEYVPLDGTGHYDSGPGDDSLGSRTVSLESDLIQDALEKFRWNKTKAAEHLGLKRTTLQYKIKKYGLE